MISVQLLNNGLAAYVFLILVSTSLAGQFLSLRVVSLSLLAAIVGGAYGAKVALVVFGSKGCILAMSAACIAGAVTAAIGALIDSWFANRVKMLALLASLGFLKVVQGVISACTGGGVEVLSVQLSSPRPSGTLLSTPAWLWTGLTIALASALLQWLLLYRTRLGASAIAVGDDLALASLFGIPAKMVQVAVQTFGGGIAGVAGVLMAVDSGLRPDLGLLVALKAFGVVIAARGRFVLLFLWATILVTLEQAVGYNWGGQLREAAGLGFVAIVLVSAGAKGLRVREIKDQPVGLT